MQINRVVAIKAACHSPLPFVRGRGDIIRLRRKTSGWGRPCLAHRIKAICLWCIKGITIFFIIHYSLFIFHYSLFPSASCPRTFRSTTPAAVLMNRYSRVTSLISFVSTGTPSEPVISMPCACGGSISAVSSGACSSSKRESYSFLFSFCFISPICFDT